ncbi:RICIN domain-containing protein [Pseudomonas sp. FEN]|uniref:RICIN domain-containing protein n=1 Tax=Pseudomonas sp. FEN TaxID=2767468 RepID=UPI00174D6C79|nr:RICIN domain-containing protein [Pseudomonas sp. FEN]
MKSKTTSGENSPAEQTPRGAPGPAIVIERGIYKIYTLLSSIPPKLINMSPRENSDYSYDVRLLGGNEEPESKWQLSYSAVDFSCLFSNEKMKARALEAVNGNVVAGPVPASNWRQSFQWFLKDAGRIGNFDYFYIENMHTGNVMEVRGSSTVDGTKIIDSPYGGTTNQKFRFIKVDNLPTQDHSQSETLFKVKNAD